MKTRTPTTARYVASAAAALLLCNLAGAAETAPGTPPATVSLDIKTQPMVEALNQFASQTGLQLIFPAEEIAARVIAPRLVGEYTPKAALTQLLADSGLVYSYVNERTIAIRAAKAGPSGAGQKTGAITLPTNGSPTLLLAQATAQSTAERERAAGESASDPRSDTESEMTVTGSHIRGVRNDTAPLMTFDREYIERSGFSNTMQLIESLPIHFKGGNAGASESGLFGDGASSQQNIARGTGLNLRGLGTVSTLTLINGRRVAPSAQGQFVDVSTIPLTAIERVEVLTDGASAIYGADAVAGVVNVILRKDFEGAETRLRYGAVTDGPHEEQGIAQTFGSTWTGGNALILAEYYKRSPLDTAHRDYIVAAGARSPSYLLPDRKSLSVMMAVDQDLPGNFDLMTNLMYSRQDIQSLAVGNGGATVSQSTPQNTQWSGVVGIGYEPFGDWRFGLEGTLARSKPVTDVRVFLTSNGALVQRFDDFTNKFDTWSADLKGDGTLFRLPAGPVRMAAGVSVRNEDLLSTRFNVSIATGNRTLVVRAKDNRDVNSAFGEIYLPLVSEVQGWSWAKRIDLSVAARHDDYSDFGSTTNPKIGLVWSPTENLDIRAAYSTSFRAPVGIEKALADGSQFVFNWNFTAPGGVGTVPVLMLSGSAPLGPEESKNIALGFSYRPELFSGLELTVNYFDIDYQDRILTPPFDIGALTRRSDFGSLISEFANDAAVQAYVDARVALGDVFIDQNAPPVPPPGYNPLTGIRYLYDWRQKNAARTQTTGIDLAATYRFARGADLFDLAFNATHINEIMTSLTADSTQFDDVDHFQRPLDWRLRGMGTWTRGGMSGTLAVNYADSYINDSLFIDERVGSWTTVDLTLGYSFSQSASALFGRAKLGLSISNLLDQDPPQALDPISSLGYDVANANAVGRFFSVQYSKQW